MTGPEVLRASPIGPWGASAADVAALCTDVTVWDTPPTGAPGKNTAITVESVRSWITDVSNLLDGRLAERYRITDTPRTGYISKAARTLAINAAASYVEAAAHPNNAAINTTSYAQVLWQRYQDGLADLEAIIAKWIAAGGTGVVPEPGAGMGAASRFPLPIFADDLQW